MVELDYRQRNFDSLALQAIENGESVALTIGGWRRTVIRRALFHYGHYCQAKREGRLAVGAFIVHGALAMLTVSFWVVYVKAEIARMKILLDDSGRALRVTFEAGLHKAG